MRAFLFGEEAARLPLPRGREAAERRLHVAAEEREHHDEAHPISISLLRGRDQVNSFFITPIILFTFALYGG